MKHLKEDVVEAKEELEEIKLHYGVLDLYKEIIADLKKASKRNFVIILILLAMLFGTNIGWLLYESQFEYVTETETIEQIQKETDNSNISGVIN